MDDGLRTDNTHEPADLARLLADQVDPPASPPAMRANRKLHGHIDLATRTDIIGWTWDPKCPDERIMLELVEEQSVLATTIANVNRPGLVRAGIGDGRHEFRISLPAGLLSRDHHTLQLRCSDTKAAVPGSPLYLEPKVEDIESVRAQSEQAEIDGAVDCISQFDASGWAWMPGAPDRAVEIEAELDGRVIARAIADRMRSDLCEHGRGTGLYGFHLQFESWVNREKIPDIIAIGRSTRVKLPPPSNLVFPDEAVRLDPDSRSRDLHVEGHIDQLTRWSAEGWAWLPHDANQSVQVEAVLDSTIIGRTIANQMRPDLLAGGKGTGRYGFKINFDAPIIGDRIPEFKTLAAIGPHLPGTLRLPPTTPAEKSARLRGSTHTLLDEHAHFTSRGPKFEEVDNAILSSLGPDTRACTPCPLLVAFYLPQFHPIPENDLFWGSGFTEWRQLSKGFPRFRGHYQPRIPRDLGFYNLCDPEALRKQCDLARSHGIGAFAYYYYWFNRKRVLERPLETHLDSGIEMPFLLIWANENWTRTWDGSEADILLKQDYKLEDDEALVEDLVRHFRDPRYVRLSGRPLFVIYNPKNIPDSAAAIRRWRNAIAERIGVEPLIFMAQTFGEKDPKRHGLDGALEFPPHKLSDHLPGRPTPDAYSSDFAGRVISYDDFVKASLDEDEPDDYPLIKTAVPSWDNDCRRPNRGLTLEDIDPAKYQRWMTELITRAINSPILGTPVVAINAWNEWAESAYLEPDVYYGAAFLNATGRAYVAAINAHIERLTSPSTDAALLPRVSVIFPCYNHARFLPERISSVLSQTVSPDEIIFLDDCSSDGSVEVARGLLQTSSIPFRIIVNTTNSGGVFRQWIKGLSLARHELIWVAETDDSADRRFLSNILPAFEREEVMAAFGRITCIDQEGAARNDLDNYFDGLQEFSWSYSSVIPAFKAFCGDFSVKNVIPNASGLVFRKPLLSASETERLFEYRFAGDWYFYALTARGGAIAYQRRARSYFRVNPNSASRSSFFTDRHLLEHQMIVQDLRHEYSISDSAIASHAEVLSKYMADRSPETLLEVFLEGVQSTSDRRRLRICIAAHSFSVGGGEILPVELANKLKELGLHVTYLLVEREADKGGNQVRKRLRNDIPVLYWDDVRDNFAGFIRDFGIQIVNSHNVSLDYRLYLGQISLGIPYIASMHGGYETVPDLLTPDFLSYLSANVSRWLYLARKNVAFLPKASCNEQMLAQSFNAVPAYDGEWIDRDVFRRENGIASGAFVFVQCSRAIEAKGWRASIRIVEQLSALVKQTLHLVLIGDGPIAATLKADYPDSRHVTFLGQLELPVRYFRCFDMGLFPSTYEGETFPLFLLECFSAGLPVISTDIGEIPRIMEAVDGLTPGLTVDHTTAPIRMVDRFVEKLAEMFLAPGTYKDFVAGAEAAARRFSMAELGSFYKSVFQEVLATGNLGEGSYSNVVDLSSPTAVNAE